MLEVLYRNREPGTEILAIDQLRIRRIQPIATGKRPPRPRVAQHLEVPGEQRPALGTVQTERREGQEVAPAAAHVQSAAGHEVEHRGVLGHADRQFERQGHDPRPQPDSRRLRGDLRQEHERPGKAALVFVEMVLATQAESKRERSAWMICAVASR